MVARFLSRSWKLCTGRSWALDLVAALCLARERWAGATTEWAQGTGGVGVFVIEDQGSQGLAQVPFDVVGQHADEDVGADTVGQAMVDGSDFEVDALAGAEGAFHAG
jgi:hypothetical protein